MPRIWTLLFGASGWASSHISTGRACKSVIWDPPHSGRLYTRSHDSCLCRIPSIYVGTQVFVRWRTLVVRLWSRRPARSLLRTTLPEPCVGHHPVLTSHGCVPSVFLCRLRVLRTVGDAGTHSLTKWRRDISFHRDRTNRVLSGVP